MIQIPIDDDDSPQFVEQVESVINGIAKLNTSDGLIVIKIDNWFDWNWRYFSGKVLGALGTWLKPLTVPPFVPNRVVWQRQFDLPRGNKVKAISNLHVTLTGTMATKRRITEIAPGKSLIWYSGKSESTGHGAIMAYIHRENDYWSWYASFLSGSSWQPSEMSGISRSELNLLSVQVAQLGEA